MDFHLKEYFITKNSKGCSYGFFFNEFNGIDYDFFNKDNNLIKTNKLIDKDVLEFSVIIDREDTIHLVFLNNIGQLIYLKNIDGEWIKNIICTLDLKSNKYKYLNLVLYNHKISLLCSYSNLVNPMVWNIQCISIKPDFEKRNITSIIAGKNFSPFNFAVDKFGNIHLLYRSLGDPYNDIYYMSFNPFISIYGKPPMKISTDSEDNLYPYIFIDNNDQIHALWAKVVSGNFSIECGRILNSQNKFKSLNMPNITNSVISPIMFEERGILKILYTYGNSVGLIFSKDYGNVWFIDKGIENISRNNLYLSKYTSNYDRDKIDNITYSYAYIDSNLSLIFHDNYNNIITNNNSEYTEDITPTQELQVIEDTFIKRLLFDLNSSLESSFISSDYMGELKDKVEKALYSNIIHLDKQLYNSTNHHDSIKNIELNLNEHKEKNKDLVDLLTSLKVYYDENSKTIEKLEYDLANLKEFLDEQNNNFLKRFFFKFK